MPEFILDTGTPQAAAQFAKLDEFTQGYIEAMFFTNTGDLDDGDLQHASVAELSPEFLAQIIDTCNAFKSRVPKDSHGRSLLDLAYDYAPRHYDERYAGHDFWYTRNGHGVGFWDRGLGPVGDQLSDLARNFGNVDLYRGDDGQIWGM
jgi:hypothetical protein